MSHLDHQHPRSRQIYLHICLVSNFVIFSYVFGIVLVDNVLMWVTLRSSKPSILCIMFIGDKVVFYSFQVFYCDNKESWNVIRRTGT